jgi:uncharacterized protein (DUF1501 family)
MTTRRQILKTMLAAGAFAVWDTPIRFAFASAPTDRRLVVVILRGALDGLAAVAAHGDPDYATVRGQLALSRQGTTPLHDLDGFFGLHPALNTVAGLYTAKEAVLFHNICTPYRDRSHFDGQNVLETGAVEPRALETGWLNRALRPMGAASGEGALAVAASAPLMLSGPAPATSWLPAHLPEPDTDFLARVRALYAGDKVLLASLEEGLDLEAKAAAAMDDPSVRGDTAKGGYGGFGNLAPLFSGAGRLLAAPDGPRVAALQASGWDTHVNQGAGNGQLARRLLALDQGIDAMRTALGPAWRRTAIVMATEFGRTVHVNGGGGTDHGTGGAAFLLGGAIDGGRVVADWPGLKKTDLRDGRDLPARTDLRALFKGVLSEHMGMSPQTLSTEIFPDSGAVAPLRRLIRA